MPTLSEITQRYTREREQAEFKLWFGPNLVLKHLVRNAEAKMSDTIKEVAMDNELKPGTLGVTPETRVDAKKAEDLGWINVGWTSAEERARCFRALDAVDGNNPNFFVSIDPMSPSGDTDASVWFQCQPDGSLRQVPEILVTDEMKSLGFQVAIKLQPRSPLLVETLEAIYRAMHAVAPVPLVSAAEDTIAQLRADRDNALDLAIAETEKYNKACDQIAILRQRLALHGESVTFPADPPPNHTAGDLKPEPKREPKPIPTGALQPTPTDRRRIGG